MSPSCRLAAVLIVRDEARSIARCLRSVSSAVDRIVVLDTGSVDDTPAIAAALGADVHPAIWTDDFSAARNQALAIADAGWNLVVDADEWLTGGHAALATMSGDTAPFVGQVRVHSVFGGDAGEPAASSAASWISRLLPHGVRYAGRVHEQPQHALPVRRLPIELGHDGYLPSRRASKSSRNRRLLEAALADRPDDHYLAYQLGKDHEIDGRHADAAHWYAVASQGRDNAGHAHDLLLRQLHVWTRLGRHADAVQLAEREMARWPNSPDFYFTLGDVLLDWAAAEPSRAAELLPLAEASWRRCIEIGESDLHEGAVAGRGSWLAAHNLAVILDGTGRPEEAAAWRAESDRWRAEAMADSRVAAPAGPFASS